jgi:hypothetical protein
MELDREQGKYKKLISFVFHDRKPNCPLDLIIKGGVSTTNDREIAAACRDEFIPWFQALPDDGMQISNKIHDWLIFEEPAEHF